MTQDEANTLVYQTIEAGGGTALRDEVIATCERQVGGEVPRSVLKRATSGKVSPYVVDGLVYAVGRRGALGYFVATWSHVVRIALSVVPCDETVLRDALNSAFVPARPALRGLERIDGFLREGRVDPLAGAALHWKYGDDADADADGDGGGETGWFEVGSDGEEVWVDG